LAEQELLNNLDAVAADMRSLAEAGLHFSLDDFGTGYSSLPQLQQLPVSVLKLDSSHVQHVADNQDSAKIVKAMISLAHGLGMQVVAEGVETEAQKEFLARHRCDQLQGYFFSPPLPFDEFVELLQKKSTTSRRSYLSVVEKK
ncbi:MAG: EAL domain-containing protein, partial [Pseudomonadales bacterium]|nr:EAL domain-containing protein [Pseudomonadales bacterium]